MSRKASKIKMPALGDFPSRKDWEEACWHKLLKTVDLIDVLTTSNERHNLAMRAAVMDRLSSGKSYGQIANELWLSPQTVSSIKKAIGENKYRSYRQRGERRKRAYFTGPSLKPNKKRRGRPVRTKYGTVYLPG